MEFNQLLNPVLDSSQYQELFESLKSQNVASEYHRGDLVREVAMHDILEVLTTSDFDLPDGPVFEYGPSTGILLTAFPERESLVVNWPTVDCMREDFEKESLAVVIADFTLEHVAKPWLATQSTYNMLKPGGLAIYTTHWVFLDHTGDQEEDYWRFSPKGLKVLFSEFSHVVTGCWSNSRLTCEILRQYADGSQGVMREDVPFVMDKEIIEAKDRIYATTVWIVAQK